MRSTHVVVREMELEQLLARRLWSFARGGGTIPSRLSSLSGDASSSSGGGGKGGAASCLGTGGGTTASAGGGPVLAGSAPLLAKRALFKAAALT